MQPRWLRPVDSINTLYSSITFAVSDPDSAITDALLNNRTALFGKEVSVQKWIDKPALIQCSRCHALGHNKASKVCPLGKDSVKCYICGGTHKSEKHHQHCPRKHAVAGICDCTHFKCLNCQNPGHNCRNVKCPARDKYRPRGNRKADKARPTAVTPAAERTPGSDGDLYEPLPPTTEHRQTPPPPTAGPSRLRGNSPVQTALDHARIDKQYTRMDLDLGEYTEPEPHEEFGDPRLEVNAPGQTTGQSTPTQIQHKAYTPSRSTGDANTLNLA
jgi:hypothetical protein